MRMRVGTSLGSLPAALFTHRRIPRLELMVTIITDPPCAPSSRRFLPAPSSITFSHTPRRLSNSHNPQIHQEASTRCIRSLAHSRTTHRALLRRIIPMDKRRTPSSRANPFPRVILRARLPFWQRRPHLLLPRSHSPHTTITPHRHHHIITPLCGPNPSSPSTNARGGE